MPHVSSCSANNLVLSKEKEGRFIPIYMEHILFGYIRIILFHTSRNEMVLRFKVALNLDKQGLTISLD